MGRALQHGDCNLDEIGPVKRTQRETRGYLEGLTSPEITSPPFRPSNFPGFLFYWRDFVWRLVNTTVSCEIKFYLPTSSAMIKYLSIQTEGFVYIFYLFFNITQPHIKQYFLFLHTPYVMKK